MRKATFAALVGASAMVVGVKIAPADTNLFVTQADFGGSQFAPGGSQAALVNGGYQVVNNPNPVPAGQAKQTNYEGLGFYESSGTNQGLVGPSDTLGDPITYPNTSLGGQNFTTNGLGNMDNYNPPTSTGHTPDANLGSSWAGLTSPTGSLVITEYTGGYSITSSTEMINDYPGTGTESTASKAFINALTGSTCLAYDITAPGGGTAASANYYETSFETYDNNPDPYPGDNTGTGFNSQGHNQANPSATVLNAANPLMGKNKNEYGTGSGLTVGNDDPGSFSIVHGTGASSYWTVYIPYAFPTTYASTLTYLQFVLEVNGGSVASGNVTVDDIHTVSPTWAAAGTGLSWNTAGVVNYNNPDGAPNGTAGHGVLTTAPNWVGGPGGYGVPNGSGVSATFGEIETVNASVGLDVTQTVGILNFNTLQWQYTLTPSSTGSSTSGNLVMDNTVNTADAAINEIAGGTAATNDTEIIAVPVTLNSTTDVTVTRGTDVLSVTGNINGSGGLTMSGAGTMQLTGSNSYSGGTTINSGTVLASGAGSLPAALPVTNNAQLVVTGTNSTGPITGTGTLTVSGGATLQLAHGSGVSSQNSLVISGNSTLDIVNNHMFINYGSGPDPISSIVSLITSGAYAGGTTITWAGTGITSTQAAANSNYGIGYADSADPGNPAGLSSGQIEIAYTLLGDANLDYKVNGTDFNLMATNFNQAVTNGWDKGDFNYDGKVNGTDFVLLANNFNQFASQSAVSSADLAALDSFAAANGISLASVPEPVSTGILAIAGLGILTRRRRSQRQTPELSPRI